MWGEKCDVLWLWLSPNVRHGQAHRSPHQEIRLQRKWSGGNCGVKLSLREVQQI